MAIKTVLYQSVFGSPSPPPFQPAPQFQDIPRTVLTAALVAGLQFSAWHSPFFGTKTPITPEWTAFDTPQAPKFSACEQQFSAWHSPFFGTQTPITPDWTAFDQPQAPQYKAAEQQFTAFHSPTPPPPPPPSSGIVDQPVTIKRQVLYQSEFKAPFVQAPPVTLIAAFTSTPFDTPQAPQIKAAEQQFTAFSGQGAIAQPPVPVSGIIDQPVTIRRQVLYQSEFTTPTVPPVIVPTAPCIPFDIPVQENHPEAQYQWSLWVSNATQPPTLPNYLSQFYVDSTIPKLTVPPALLQFNDLPMGPEQTTIPPVQVVLGRWGPDETAEERRRRHKAGIFFQWEEMPDRSEFAPDPVEHPPHEPQKWADESAAVRTDAKASPVSGVEYAAVLNQQIEEDFWDDELLELAQKWLENGWRR